MKMGKNFSFCQMPNLTNLTNLAKYYEKEKIKKWDNNKIKKPLIKSLKRKIKNYILLK